MARSVLFCLICALTMPAFARDAPVSGRLVGRTVEGYWACFAQQVAVGAPVEIAPQGGSAVTARGRIGWSSPLPPYEAHIVDIRALVKRLAAGRTEYERWVGERSMPRVEGIPPVSIGYTASCAPASAPHRATGDTLLGALVSLMKERPEVREWLSGREASELQAADVRRAAAVLVGKPWADPVANRLAERAAEALRWGNLVGARVPPGWFPPGAARETGGGSP